MLVDANLVEDRQQAETDICIIGAGAAGITLARELNGHRLRVAVLESGGLAYDQPTQSLYHGKNIGLPSFDVHVNRLRYFGGTTNHWTGHCRPLDPIDFEQKDWIPNSGWPLTRQQLNPFYQRAQPIVGLGPDTYEDIDYWIDKLGFPALSLDASRLQSTVYNQSPPTRFGPAYQSELSDSENVSVYLNANVLELQTNATDEVQQVKVGYIDGPRFSLAAKVFIMATGGMENARLLMLSERASSSGLGINSSMVGRFFMDHILLRPGADISLSRPDIDFRLYQQLHQMSEGRMFCVLTASEALLRKEQLGNFRIHLVRSAPRFDNPIGKITSKLSNPVLPEGDKTTAAQKTIDSISLHIVVEPAPNPDSRLILSEETDLFGQAQLAVDWQLDERDLRTTRRALDLAALEFGRLNIGRAFGALYYNRQQWPKNLEAGRHHCGTTRMSKSAENGVVDENCKAHGLNNLYIAGSSVFPTIGYANPTLTIVALALRLGDHLKQRFSA